MLKNLVFGGLLLAGTSTGTAAAAADETCTDPQPARCEGTDCVSGGALGVGGNVTDAATGREYFLDYPCDLKEGEDVLFILNIHGAGSFANWQRHYFPASDLVSKYRLVVATPTAATETPFIPGGPAVRRWEAQADDAFLQGIAEHVFEKFGPQHIRGFWLAGHSQGGFTSRRIACSAYFGPRVDGWLSLSGGRVGQAPFVPAFGPPKADGSPPDPRQRPNVAEEMPECDYSHIFAVGQHEIESLPGTSPLAERFHCGAQVRKDDVVDSAAGHVWDYDRAGYPVWGMQARPGTAEVFAYPDCDGGRVIMDVVRQDKGHTEGLEPNVTDAIVHAMAKAAGGKARAYLAGMAAEDAAAGAPVAGGD